MTAPISVERLCVHTADHGDGRKPYGMMMPDARGEYVRHSDYAALLHQLAERDAEVSRLRRECDLRKHAVDRWVPCPDHRDKVDGRCQVCAKEAAERAREECVKLAEKWERISSTHGVRCFTGDDHLIFANELRVALGLVATPASGGPRDG